ncbi:histidine phosphatase superfamily [Microdochium trichocladiopsis]|uniref:Histidine phosphatase superfamily n=1 Tax=Microdochium trichocladiopsis TaxID=1682393 RepID=A0A9P9BZZ5_9PEZI|nr:histidine phosphatase superfamily [Microdochium trichocladiopsis]KAH7040619.1 histidine phosphatase superfamily [Microdochium trichocladiopsis]
MRLLLIRHGESVDNVAGLYAGSRDSPLTNHGVLQARRLGAHLADLGRRHALGPVKRIFTSNLQRAYRTAEAIAHAQADSRATDACDVESVSASGNRRRPSVVQLPELREKDFGSDEGKKYGTRAAEKRDPGVFPGDAETREAMRARVHQFLTGHLEPYIAEASPLLSDSDVIVIVAHGIILNSLVRAMLARYPAHAGVQLGSPAGSSDFSVAWSNTGVLQARLRTSLAPSMSQGKDLASSSSPSVVSDVDSRSRMALGPFVIESTNNVDHLQGLKKTRGGIGSSKFDSRQKTMDTFFRPTAKKRKHEGSD